MAAQAAMISGRGGDGDGRGGTSIMRAERTEEQKRLEDGASEILRKLSNVDKCLSPELNSCFTRWGFTSTYVISTDIRPKYIYTYVKGNFIVEATVCMGNNTIYIYFGTIKEVQEKNPFRACFSEDNQYALAYSDNIGKDVFKPFIEYMQLTAKKAMLCYAISQLDCRGIQVSKIKYTTMFQIEFTTGMYFVGTTYKIKAQITGTGDDCFAKISFLRDKESTYTNAMEMKTDQQFVTYIQSNKDKKSTLMTQLIILNHQLDHTLRITHI